MKWINLYTWFTGTQSDFTNNFKNNEQLFKQANSFWNNLDDSCLLLLIIGIIIGIAVAAYYYTDYNNAHGFHYRPKHWAIFMVVAFVASFVASIAFLYFTSEPALQGADILELKLSFCNAIYSLMLYLLTSFIWCNWFPTNAYRLLKI